MKFNVTLYLAGGGIVKMDLDVKGKTATAAEVELVSKLTKLCENRAPVHMWHVFETPHTKYYVMDRSVVAFEYTLRSWT